MVSASNKLPENGWTVLCPALHPCCVHETELLFLAFFTSFFIPQPSADHDRVVSNDVSQLRC